MAATFDKSYYLNENLEQHLLSYQKIIDSYVIDIQKMCNSPLFLGTQKMVEQYKESTRPFLSMIDAIQSSPGWQDLQIAMQKYQQFAYSPEFLKNMSEIGGTIDAMIGYYKQNIAETNRIRFPELYVTLREDNLFPASNVAEINYSEVLPVEEFETNASAIAELLNSFNSSEEAENWRKLMRGELDPSDTSLHDSAQLFFEQLTIYLCYILQAIVTVTGAGSKRAALFQALAFWFTFVQPNLPSYELPIRLKYEACPSAVVIETTKSVQYEIPISLSATSDDVLSEDHAD